MIVYNFRVDIDLNNGVYIFPQTSGIGKTYLAKLLCKLESLGHRCTAYIYPSKIPLCEVLDPNRYDIVLLDRYDMYYKEGVDLISEFSKTGIVLIDCKRDLFDIGAGYCTISRTEAGIRVWKL